MKIAYIDAVGGIAGDMLLAGFLGATAPDGAGFLARLLRSLGLPDAAFAVEDVRRGGFAGRLITVTSGERRVDWHSLDAILGIIDAADLPDPVKKASGAAFTRLAEAEARAHGKPLDHLHLHETGDIDAVVEITGTLLAVHEAGIERIVCSPLPMGRGTVTCRHGRIPLPAPAVAQMLDGVPVTGVDLEAETVTPTGLALARQICGAFGAMPSMTVETVGTGAGSRDDGSIPNLVRVFVGRALDETASKQPDVRNMLIETNIDDMPGTLLGHVIERLLRVGALDAYVTPVVMKKGRPAHTLSILCETSMVDALLRTVFEETTSTGARFFEVSKRTLPRRNIDVATPWGSVPVKVAVLGEEAVHVAPEYEACRAIAERTAVPLKRVIEEVAREARRQVGRDIHDKER